MTRDTASESRFSPRSLPQHQLLMLTGIMSLADRDRDRHGSWRRILDDNVDADWAVQVQGDIATCVPAVGRAKVGESKG